MTPILPPRAKTEAARLRKQVTAYASRIEERDLQDAALHYPQAGGKAIRPVLAVLACEAAGGEATDADPVAVSVELLHTFSLVHDDLMDKDATRRGVPTVHEVHDDAAAILSGDVLFALAFEVLDDLPENGITARIATDLARTARRLCEGQHLDMRFEDAWPTVGEYETMISKKTAELFSSATRNGARVAKPERARVEALSVFGHTLGLAFQIQDDVLDLVGDEATLGKPVGSDVQAGKKTHPILGAHNLTDSDGQRRLEAVLDGNARSPQDVEWVLGLVEETGAIQASKRRARDLFDEAIEALDQGPANPARGALSDLVGWLVDRDR